MSRLVRLTLATLAVLLGLAGVAQADSISITAPDTQLIETDLPVTLNWTASVASPYAFATIKTGSGCGASATADTGNKLIEPAGTLPQSGSLSGTREASGNAEPGTFTICAYLQEGLFGAVLASASKAVTLRPDTGSIVISPPSTAVLGSEISFPVNVTTELRRYEYVTVKPGTTCGANYGQDSFTGSNLGNSGGTVLRTSTVVVHWTVGSTNNQGRPVGPYVVCAYVQKDASSPAPIAIAKAIIQVSTTGGGSTISTCPAVQKAQKAVAKDLASYRAYTHKALKAHGSARARYQKLAKQAHSKYLNAKKTLAKAKQKGC
jgi:hypothetical protein